MTASSAPLLPVHSGDSGVTKFHWQGYGRADDWTRTRQPQQQPQPQAGMGWAGGQRLPHRRVVLRANALPESRRERVAMAVGAGPLAEKGVLSDGDTVAVVGCTGNVGRLVTVRLANMGMALQVRGVARDAERAAEVLQGLDVQIMEADTKEDGGEGGKLQAALSGCSVVIVCTGTTAFPTKAWQGNNTPQQVDAIGVRNVVDAWVSASAASGTVMKRMCLMSSVGVTRKESFPFVILNGAGVLDAKAEGEAYVTSKANEVGFAYTICRPGQLFGGPYNNNYYLGTLAQLDKDQSVRAVAMEVGDRLLGDTLRSSCAEALVQASRTSATEDVDFVVVNRKGDAPDDQAFRAIFDTASFRGEQGQETEVIADTLLPSLAAPPLEGISLWWRAVVVVLVLAAVWYRFFL